MQIYRGDHQQNFTINNHNSSRYGINALFFATNIKLARLYAIHHSRKRANYKGGFVYQAEIPNYIKQIDFGGGTSYGRELRDIVMQHHKTTTAIQIYNILDYPSQNLLVPNPSDVIAVFDFSIIKSLAILESNVKL